jgi:hypothetical protein
LRFLLCMLSLISAFRVLKKIMLCVKYMWAYGRTCGRFPTSSKKADLPSGISVFRPVPQEEWRFSLSSNVCRCSLVILLQVTQHGKHILSTHSHRKQLLFSKFPELVNSINTDFLNVLEYWNRDWRIRVVFIQNMTIYWLSAPTLVCIINSPMDAYRLELVIWPFKECMVSLQIRY